jgi:hypothetical protein
MAASCFFLPPSPHWLLAVGRRAEAVGTIRRLSIQEVEAEKDILNMPNDDSKKQYGMLKSMAMDFSKLYRARTVLALVSTSCSSHMNGVLYYAPILFAQAGLPE